MFLNGKGSLRRRHHLTLVIRELTQRRRRRQRERKKAIGLDWQNNNFSHVNHAFLYISLPSVRVSARLRCETA